jgi:ribonuclease D
MLGITNIRQKREFLASAHLSQKYTMVDTERLSSRIKLYRLCLIEISHHSAILSGLRAKNGVSKISGGARGGASDATSQYF